MKATFISFSLTGNTEYVAHKIAEALEKHSHTSQFFNMVPVIRSLNLVIRKREESKVTQPTETEKEYIALLDGLRGTEILGVGCLVDCGIPPLVLLNLLNTYHRKLSLQ